MLKIHRPLFLLAGFAALIVNPGFADVELPSILVSAGRTERPGVNTPASITVISRQEIQKYRPRNLKQLLQSRGGLQIDDLSGDGGNATIDMRGFGPAAGSNTLVLVNGRRLNNSGDRASPDLSSIAIQTVDRIEIVQGSAGTLFGNQAVGGVINIITRQPQAFQAEIQLGLGDYGGHELHAGLGDRLANGLSYQVSATRQENNNYRDNNRINRKDLNLRLDYPLAQGNLFLEHQRLRDHQELPGSLYSDELADDREQSAAAYLGDFSRSLSRISRLGLRQGLGAHWHFEGELSQRHNERDFQTSFRGFRGSVATQDRKVRGFNPRFIGSYPLAPSDLRLTLGADFERTDYTLLTDFGLQQLDQSIDAYYAQLVMPFGEVWSASAGLRSAQVQNEIVTNATAEHLDDRLTLGSLGLVYRPGASWRLFLRADQNYRFATVDEHTNVVFDQPVGIKNQTGISYEAGVEWHTQPLSAKAVAYRLDLQDEISFDASGFINTNLKQTRRRGLILEAAWSAGPDLLLGGSFSYTDPKITAGPFLDKRIPLVSARHARLFADWDFADNWSLLSEALLVSERVLGGDFDNQFPTLAGYGLVNSTLRFHQPPWQLLMRVNNLLNREYASSGAVGLDANSIPSDAYFPAPERNFWLTLAYRFE